jgi:uncharacterized protein (TIGR02147 family)
MLNIYNYTEFHTFLTDAWRDKKARNRSFSMSSWAKQLGLENSSPLSLAFKGKRALPKKYLPQVIHSLDLDTNQAAYLEAMLDLFRARTPEQKLFYMGRLKALSPSSELNSEIVEEFKYLCDPIHSAIIEMTDLKTFKMDPAWVQSRIAHKVSLVDVEEAIKRLQDLKFLKLDESGKLKKAHRNLISPPDVADLGTQNYHKAICEIASQAVGDHDILTREFNSYSFNMRDSDMNRAKSVLRKFLNDFFSEFEAKPGEGDDVYQLNLQLFKMSK